MKNHWLAFTMRSSLLEGIACLKDAEVPMQTFKKPQTTKAKNAHKNQTKTQNKQVLLKTHFTHWCEVSHWINFLVGLLQTLAVLILYSWSNTLLGEEFPSFPSLSPCFPEIRFPGITSLEPSVVEVWSPIHFPYKTLKWNHFSHLGFLPFHILWVNQGYFLLLDIHQQRYFT